MGRRLSRAEWEHKAELGNRSKDEIYKSARRNPKERGNHAIGINVSQSQWDRIFGKKKDPVKKNKV